MDPRAINKTIELYRAKAERVRAEYRAKQLAEQGAAADGQEGEAQAGPGMSVQTQDGHDKAEKPC